MKVLFAGPSIYGANINLASIELRPPAAHGDLARAVLGGASAIGLVDGVFEAIAAVWHKEILFALQRGVTVAGAASMGALRASECANFGMIPIGKIAHSYLDGSLDDDAAVALIHGPTELGSPPFTDALVDIENTLSIMLNSGCINITEAKRILENARKTFFKKRTIDSIVSELPNAVYLKQQYKKHFTSQKQADALELIAYIKQLPENNIASPLSWELEQPHTWTTALKKIADRKQFDQKGEYL